MFVNVRLIYQSIVWRLHAYQLRLQNKLHYEFNSVVQTIIQLSARQAIYTEHEHTRKSNQIAIINVDNLICSYNILPFCSQSFLVFWNDVNPRQNAFEY